MTRNIALVLAYDGTAYHGWQAQRKPHLPTVSETLAKGIESIVEHPVTLLGCGRTDAGVHARRYVANFRTDCRIPADRLPFALRSVLPSDIAVWSAREVPMEFHAISSCQSKEYTYRIYCTSLCDPFARMYAYHWAHEPQLEIWRRAARAFVGRQDFAAVRAQGSATGSTVRTVMAFDVLEQGEQVAFRVRADGFLYNMARAMVGTVLYAGLGKIADVGEVLRSRDRRRAGPTLPPHGLYMTNVWYEEAL